MVDCPFVLIVAFDALIFLKSQFCHFCMFDKSVAELIKKNRIEVSGPPCVSNIVRVPKKDPFTGKFPSRINWLHSKKIV
ncbi:hypothetical protein Plhal304r1_c012g0047861 [Plasmopara halstedii]